MATPHPDRSGRVSQQDLVQYLLVALNAIALVLGLVAITRAGRLVEGATRDSALLTEVLSHYADLSSAAAQVNQPGNDLFESGSVAGERLRFAKAHTNLLALMAAVRAELDGLPIAHRGAATRDFAAVQTRLNDIGTSTERVFDLYEDGRERDAAAQLAHMDRAYGVMQEALNGARRNMATAILITIREQENGISSLRRSQLVLVSVLLIVIGLAFVHGRRVAIRAQTLSRERWQAVEEIKTKEAQLQDALATAARQRDEITAIINATSDGIMLFSNEPRVMWANDRAAELLGFPSNDLTTRRGRDVRDGVASRTERPETFMKQAAVHFAQGTEDYVDYLTLVSPVRRVLKRHSRPALHAGSVIGRVFTYTDVTREADLERARADFVARASHELRTPLTSIHGALQLAMSGTAERMAEEDRELLQISVSSTERLVRLVNRMLDLSKIEVGRMPMDRTPLEPQALLDEAVASMQPEAGRKGMRIVLDCGSGGRPMLGDHDMLLRVLANLINNAVKYAPAHSTITVSCRATGLFNQVAVEDEGPGIDDDALPKLFQPFTRVGAQEREQSGGTGIGLSLCRAIIEQHEGQIWAENRSHCSGSRFVFTVPVPPS